jgi:predicted metal-dependent hydrolase
VNVSLETALINGRPLKYSVRRSKRARQVKVQVCRREGVVVVLPWRTSRSIMPELLADWGEWMDRQAEEHGVRHGPHIKQYAGGSEVTILGQPCRIEVREAPAGRRASRVERVGDVVVMHLKPADVFETRAVLEKYLRRVARNDLQTRTRYWSERLALYPSRVIVGERTTRWGSCSPSGTLSFCYRLVMAPPHVVDAIVAHELCHLRFLNHSQRFYALLDKVCPWRREADAWLREHQDDLLF